MSDGAVESAPASSRTRTQVEQSRFELPVPQSVLGRSHQLQVVAQSDLSTLLSVGVPAVCGSISVGVAIIVSRRLRDGAVRTELARPFISLAASVAALGAIHVIFGLLTPIGTQLNGGTGFLFVLVPWLVFAARYVGFGRYVTRGRVIVGVIVVVALVGVNTVAVLVAEGRLDGVSVPTIDAVQTATSVVNLALLLLVFALIGSAVVTTYRHDRLSIEQGIIVTLPVVGFLFAVQASRPATPLVNDVLVGGAFAVATASLALGVTRFEILTRVPATQRLGERAALTEADEAVLVLDDQTRVVRVNELAERTFGAVDTLSDVTDHSIATLTERKTITCRTTNGRRQFEPGVSPLVDTHDEVLGYTVRLFDVTGREIRRQRLAVLNRILRHNVRNQLDVIRAHAEGAELDPAVEGVDRLAEISEEARRVQELMERTTTTDQTETALGPLIEEVVAEVTAGTNADVTVAVTDLTVRVDRERCRYALRHLVENAVEHSEGASPRVVIRGERTDSDVRLVVADDGPGIPESERAVIEAGHEAQLEHASGLGLWGANWAVQSAGGSLSFGESDLGGATVTLSFPTDSSDE